MRVATFPHHGGAPVKICSLILILFLLFASPAYCDEDIPPYQPLINRLSQDGFELEFLLRLFVDPRVEISPATINLTFVSGENPELYAPFLKPESILLSRGFLSENLPLFKQMEKDYEVDKEVVVAILLVESKFGENIGKHRVVPTLSSMVLMDSAENLHKTYLLARETVPEISYERLEELAKRRAKWAYHELKCFLNIVRQEPIDPLEIYGSYAGALGMAQFVPSSYVAFAQSRNGLGGWLLNKEEAIVSIAKYLKTHGWKKNLPLKRKKEILWYYNHSTPYIETILTIAQKIKS
jgi:membrane-bound lytic murein transglycosylase B